MVTAGFDGLLRLWDVPSGRLLTTWPGHREPIWDVAFSSDGKHIASAAGDWQKAHEIVQQEKSAMGSWLHGIVHILEGDMRNAQGWYKRADRAFPGADAVKSEITAARAAVDAEASRR